MKRIFIFSAVLIASCCCALAQNRSKSVYLEIMGPSNMVGVSYDARIRHDSNLGYRVGVAYSSLKILDVNDDDDQRFVSVPLGLNYLVGNSCHQLEIGLGACPGLYHRAYDTVKYNEGTVAEPAKVHESENLFGCIAYATIGYRYTSKKGLQLRCGFSPAFDFGNKYADNKITPLYPYLSVGYAF